MKDMVSVRVKTHDSGPECDECGKPMSTVEFVDNVPKVVGRLAFVCFRCNENEDTGD